jgi:hypothetical protein
MSRQEELEGIVEESGPLLERLEQCRSLIGRMCSEHRPPKMTIPVQWYDEDFYINTTLRDTAAELARLRAIEAAAKELLATFEQYRPDGNHFAEFWWKVKPTATMFARDEALDALAAALKAGNE